jgi:predicted O-methyltransferase YrrM
MSIRDDLYIEIKKLEGWVSPERGVELYDLIVKEKPVICVEIGVFGGRSLISQAMGLRTNGSGRVYGIDPWKTEAALEGENTANKEWWSKNVDLHGIHSGTMDAIWRLGLDEWAIVIRAKSQDAKFLFRDGIDWLFIDGNHSEVSSSRDVLNYVPLVRSGGIIIFDDADWPSTQTALKALDIHCDLLKDAGGYRIYKKK